MSRLVPVAATEPQTNNADFENAQAERYDLTVFKDITLSAQSYVVYDPLDKRILAEKNSTSTYPLASLTKVMTALVAQQNIPSDQKVTITYDDLILAGDSGLRVGDIWSRDALVQYMLSVSSNDAARALARAAGTNLKRTGSSTLPALGVFTEAMNTFAAKNMMTTLSFNNESGLDLTSTKAGGYGNARDVATMFWYAYQNSASLFDTTAESYARVPSAQGTNLAKNTNSRASTIPGLVMSKTGFTDLALGNLGVVIETSLGRPVVIVVLHSTKEGRFRDVETLRQKTVAALQ